MSSEYLNNKTFEKIIIQYQKSKKDKNKYELILEDLKDTCERKEKRKTKCDFEKEMLLKNDELFKESLASFEDAKQKLASAFQTLSTNLVNCYKFNLIDADDAIQEGVMICFEKIDRFDTAKGKAFNYMTTCILNHFRQLYRSARNFNELKKKYHDFLQIKFSSTIVRNGKETSTYQDSSNDQ